MRCAVQGGRPARAVAAVALVLTGAAAAVLGAAGCGESWCEGREPSRAEVAVGGCESYRRLQRPVCLLGPGAAVTLAVAAGPEAVISVRPEAEALPATSVAARRFRVAPPDDAPELVVTVVEGGREATWTLALGRLEELPAIREARAARAERRFDSAKDVLVGALAQAGLTDADRARLLGMRARVAISQGDLEAAERDLSSALPLGRAAGLISDVTLDTMALTWILTGAMRLGEATAALDALAAWAPDYDEARVHIDANRARIHLHSGDLRAALRSYSSASALAETLGLTALRTQVDHAAVVVLLALGRYRESAAVLEGLAEATAGRDETCARAALLHNLGWTRLSMVEAGMEASPLPVLDEALAAVEAGCGTPQDLSNSLINLALAHWQRGEPARARAMLERAVAAGGADSPEVASWRLDLEGRLALGAGDTGAALKAFSKLAALAREAGVPDAALRATLGTAETLRDAGQHDAAIAAWQQAEQMLDAALRAVPLGEGQGSFVASATRGPRGHVDLLVALGRVDEALSVARRSRVREIGALRQLRSLSTLSPAARQRWDTAVATWRAERQALDAAAAEDWKLAADRRAQAADARTARERKLREVLDDALAAVDADRGAERGPFAGPGELALLIHPGQRGYWVFAASAGTVRAIHVDAPPSTPDGVSAVALEPFRAELAAAARLRILAYGPWREVDFHALPWDGAPLSAALPVTYAVDLPPLPAEPAGSGVQALVVADPARNLTGARAELDAIRALLRAGETAPIELSAEAATLAAVQQGLAEVGLFHFAGHGWFAGLGGWESALGLAAGQRLTVGDILALPRAPRTVVLSGCETGRSDRSGLGATLGLAEAFVIAGTRAVIAATRPVADELASAMSVALYAGGRDALAADPAAALQRAQNAVRAARPDSDWASFRVIGP